MATAKGNKPFLFRGKKISKQKQKQKRQMATSKVVSRLSSRLGPLTLKPSKSSLASEVSQLKPTSCSPIPSTRRVLRSSRLPLQLSCMESMIPLHSAVASARLISSLSVESRNWALVPQGISMPL